MSTFIWWIFHFDIRLRLCLNMGDVTLSFNIAKGHPEAVSPYKTHLTTEFVFQLSKFLFYKYSYQYPDVIA